MRPLEHDDAAEFASNGSLDALEDEVARRGSDSLAVLVWLARLAQQSLQEDAAANTIGLPRTLDRFELELLLGTGGYGAVFRAVDTHLGRPVALKLAWPGVMIDPTTSQRFLDEPRTMAAVKHRGLVEVYDSGLIDMVSFISMELIEGPTLAQWRKCQPSVSIQTAVKIIGAVAQAIHFAHDKGITHRDLKPSNVLLRPLTERDELPFDPVVTDFGLARRSHASQASLVTGTCAVVGTDHYMAPEQAAGLNREVGPRSDVFSLGVMLYELVAGRHPFEGETSDLIRLQTQVAEPIPLHVLRRGVPSDLETIILKCLEKLPEQRYSTAQHLADDLSRFLRHEPIHARPATFAHRCAKFLQRQPMLVALGAVLALSTLAIAGLVGAWIDDRLTAAHQVEAAQAAAAVAEANERQHQYVANIQHAAAALRRGGRREVEELLDACRSLAVEPLRCGLEWELLWSQSHDVDKSLDAHRGSVHTVRFSCAGDSLVSGGEDGRVVLWDTKSWIKRTEWNAGVGEVNAVEVSADGTLVAIGGDDGRVVVQRMSDRSIVFDQRVVDGRVFALTWLGDQLQLAVGSECPMLTIVDPVIGSQRRTAPLMTLAVDSAQAAQPVREISDLMYLPGQKAVAIAAPPHMYFVVGAASLEVLRSWHEPNGQETIACASKGRDYLATSTRFDANPALGDVARITNALDGAEVARVVMPHDAELLRFSRDASVLTGAFRNGSIWTWDTSATRGTSIPKGRCFLAHHGRATRVDISPDNDWLASGGRDGRINLWQGRAWGDCFDVRLDERPALTQFSPCGRWFAVVNAPDAASGHAYQYFMFDAHSGDLLWSKETSHAVHMWNLLAFSPSGDEVLFWDADGSCSGHDPRTAAVKTTYQLPQGVPHTEIQFSPDEEDLLLRGPTPIITTDAVRATPTESHEVHYLDRQTGTVVRSYVYGDIHHAACFRTLLGPVWAQMSNDRTVVLSESPTSAPLLTLPGPPEHVTIMAASSDGRYLAAATGPGTVYSWDLLKPTILRKYIGHHAPIHQLCFSPDCQTLLSVSLDGTGRLWSMATGAELLQLGAEDQRVVSAALHPSGELLVLTIEHAGRYGWQIQRLGPNRRSWPKTFNVKSGCDKSKRL